jgi:hypothetical protein
MHYLKYTLLHRAELSITDSLSLDCFANVYRFGFFCFPTYHVVYRRVERFAISNRKSSVWHLLDGRQCMFCFLLHFLVFYYLPETYKIY